MTLLRLSPLMLSLIAALFGASVAAQDDVVRGSVFAWGATASVGLAPPNGESVDAPASVDGLSGKCIRHVSTSEKSAIYATCEGGVLVSGDFVTALGRYQPNGGEAMGQVHAVDDLRPHKVVMVAAGECHFAALTDDARIFTWGCNEAGQLAHHRSDLPYAVAPEEVKGLSKTNVRLVYAGGKRSAAVSDDGKMWMWGDGVGETGEWAASNKARRPRLVSVLPKPVCQAALGSSHTAVISRDGDLYMWGNGAEGQLGLGDFGVSRVKPVSVGGKLRKNTCYVSAGHDFTVSVSQDARVFLFGSNGFPKPFEKVWFQDKGRPIQIGAGNRHMDVLLADGRIATWGSSRAGQVGRPMDRGFSLDPGFIESPDGVAYSQIAVAGDHSVAISNGVPVPSLCQCNNRAFESYGTDVRFKPVCTSDQTQCPDGACCGAGHTCCRSRETVDEMGGYRATFASHPNASSFQCFPNSAANCCPYTNAGPTTACRSNLTCVGSGKDSDPARCEPPKSAGLTAAEASLKGAPALRSSGAASPPGFTPGVGKCGARKATCPDESCCGSGTTCCPSSDGFGCCASPGAVCCKPDKSGRGHCCPHGWTCSEDGTTTCAKVQGEAKAPAPGKKPVAHVQKIASIPVESQCGANKHRCPDSSCCPSGAMCCNLGDSGEFGCCPYGDNAVCCADGAGCCPANHTCSLGDELSQCVRVRPDGTTDTVPVKGTPSNSPRRKTIALQKCDDERVCGTPGTCCHSKDQPSRCCDFANATCCDGGFCCPAGAKCDINGKCIAPNGNGVPAKTTRSSKPADAAANAKDDGCAGRTQCSDNSCCPLGSMCCTGPDGSKTQCCPSMSGVCCAAGGCCEEGDECTADGKCYDPETNLGYALFTTSDSEPRAKPSAGPAPGVPTGCHADEKMCSNGNCCPFTSTCVDQGRGEYGCCPQSHAKSCGGSGGCCPSGTTCDVEGKKCLKSSGTAVPMLGGEPAMPPTEEFSPEECNEDERTCSIDDGCCGKEETCCNVQDGPFNTISACCPHEDATCCPGAEGGCCPQGTFCSPDEDECVNAADEPVHATTPLRPSTFHAKAGLPDIDCADGTTCAAFTTCCSLGVDDDSGAEVYGCCPHEDGVCCSEFEGCCPEGHRCDNETQGCVNVADGSELAVEQTGPTTEPPTYVCEFPHTQCPNGLCCEAGAKCAETPSGNFMCIAEGYLPCSDGRYACPKDLWCDAATGDLMCSEVQDNDPSVKEALIARYKAEDVRASTETRAAVAKATGGGAGEAPLLMQQAAGSGKDVAAATKKKRLAAAAASSSSRKSKPPLRTWFPKKLVPVSTAEPAIPTSLATVLAAKVCQHVKAKGRAVQLQDQCYVSNVNGHYVSKERVKVDRLVEEYQRRLCAQQGCTIASRGEYVFEAEVLTWEVQGGDGTDGSGGTGGAVGNCTDVEPPPAPTVAGGVDGEEALEAVVGAEEAVADVATGGSAAGDLPSDSVKPAHISNPANAFTLPPDQDVDPAALNGGVKLVGGRAAPTDQMWKAGSAQDAKAPEDAGDFEMNAAFKPEPFMGKEACDEAVDLDGPVANKVDIVEEGTEAVELSLAQMNAEVKNDDLDALKADAEQTAAGQGEDVE